MRPAIYQVLFWCSLFVMASASSALLAQETDPSVEPNPTRRLIIPLQDQSEEQQLADQWGCYGEACEKLGWDPYLAYNELVEEGFAVALSREEWEESLLILAMDGAVTGAVAGEILGRPVRGAEVGAAIALAMGVVHCSDLLPPDDPQAQRILARFERQLKNWNRKFAACLRPKGYRVPSS